MISISNTTPRFPMPPSPRARIDAKIAAATSAGTISQTDETALETAVDAIGQSLRGGTSAAANAAAPNTAGAVSASAAGTSFKDKLDGLIDAQVTSGMLTDAQATELKGMFGQGAPSQGVQGQDADGDRRASAVHGHHHHGGGGGGGMAAIMAALDGSDSTDGSTDTSAIDAPTGTTSTSTSGSTATNAATAPAGISPATTSSSSTTAVSSTDLAAQQLDKMITFLEKVRESIGSAQTYGTSSAGNSGTDAAGMMFSGLA